MNKDRIGFIGLGNMGGRMTRRLLDAGIGLQRLRLRLIDSLVRLALADQHRY